MNQDNLFSKKNLITYLLLGILAMAIPLGIQLVQKQVQLKSRAAGETIKFSGTGVTCTPGGSSEQCTTTSTTFTIQLDSPYGISSSQQN